MYCTLQWIKTQKYGIRTCQNKHTKTEKKHQLNAHINTTQSRVFYEFFISEHRNSLERFCMRMNGTGHSGRSGLLLLTTRDVVYNFSGLCLYVRLSEHNFQKPWHSNFISAHPLCLKRVQVKFVYEGYWVKVTVTWAKKTWNVIAPPIRLSESMSTSTKTANTLYHEWEGGGKCTNITMENSTSHISWKALKAELYYEYSSVYRT